MSLPCNQVPKTLTGTANDASDKTETRAATAIYVSSGPVRSTFTSYAEKYAYFRGKANCTSTNFPCAANQKLN